MKAILITPVPRFTFQACHGRMSRFSKATSPALVKRRVMENRLNRLLQCVPKAILLGIIKIERIKGELNLVRM